MLANNKYPVKTPHVDLVEFSVISNSVTVTGRHVGHGYGQTV